MLERYGIVTRETVLAEGVPGGFSTLYARARQPRAARHRPPRLLRRGARRRPVRPARRGRAAALAARSRRLATRCSPRPTRPTPTAPRSPGRSARAAGGQPARRAPTSCCATASRSSTSSAAAAASCASPSSRATSWRRRCGRWPTRSPPASCPSSAVEKLDGEPVIGSGHEEALIDAGFSRGPRKLTAAAR